MKILRHYLTGAVICLPFLVAIAGCSRQPVPSVVAKPADLPSQPPAPSAIAPASIPSLSPHKDDPVTVVETPPSDRVPNPLYHPGRTDSLDLSGKYVGKETLTLSGKITFIVTKETAHGKPANVMTTALDLTYPDGTRKQSQFRSVYEMRRDGRLRLLYKDSDSGQQWVESASVSPEPRDYVVGHSESSEVRFDDGSVERTTSVVTRDGDNVKVTGISKSTEKDVERNSTETYWLDASSGSIVRYSGSMTGSDGSEMTISGR